MQSDSPKQSCIHLISFFFQDSSDAACIRYHVHTVKLCPCNRACHFFFPRKALKVSVVASVAASGTYPPESNLPYTAMSGCSPKILEVLEGPSLYIPTATLRIKGRSLGRLSSHAVLTRGPEIISKCHACYLVIHNRNPSGPAGPHHNLLERRIHELQPTRPEHERFQEECSDLLASSVASIEEHVDVLLVGIFQS